MVTADIKLLGTALTEDNDMVTPDIKLLGTLLTEDNDMVIADIKLLETVLTENDMVTADIKFHIIMVNETSYGFKKQLKLRI
jgi:hypothetical protein